MRLAFLVSLLAAQVASAAVPAIEEFDVTKYTGRWYQISADRFVTATFERNAECVTADYTLDGDQIRLVNRNLVNGEAANITGVAYAEDATKPAELTVEFDTGVKGSYWIVKIGDVVDDQYEYAVVTDKNGLTLFVLARTPTFQSDDVDQFLSDNGFTGPLFGPIATNQGGCDYLYDDEKAGVGHALHKVALTTTATTATTTTTEYCPSSPARVHAGCDLTATFGEACGVVAAEIKARVNGEQGWLDSHNNGTYKVTAEDASSLSLERVTGDGKYVDKLNFHFRDEDDGSCTAFACSQSQVTSILDFGTNHCNLFILYCGSDAGCPFVKHDLSFTEHINSCSDSTTSCLSITPTLPSAASPPAETEEK
mmetsp:Transcript_35664/g.114041  ORF Transcript_35664/g.114041 Transcript_35664/m.114041 type:complete len:368 (+) Transcript_35664:88-1191(+)|eukprot:CAMPEP_0118892740 /NCGR_PEP_ID=MMETSP1166-20130328/2213_1 /TAXON_ID=1104430 /ORGANISM="Chrysoreinhardia sp, Strain CCMP3193" /LENGTH=367 /DNA_ID=CAMNT_0006831491 /DNA_START=66 /DNA_END=1169 /DNA_ORIENTATION=-